MKIINPDSGFLIYQKVFKKLQSGKSRLVIWQIFPENGKRIIHETTLSSFHLDTKLLYLAPVDDYLDPSLPLYCFIEDEQCIFKSQVGDLKDSYFSLLFPEEIKLLEEPDVETIKQNIPHLNTIWLSKRSVGFTENLGSDILHVKSMAQRSSRDQDFLNDQFAPVTLDDEDKLFADKRESKRMRPKIDKFVKLIKNGEDDFNIFKLFDLSQGGMGFITTEPDEFPKGSEVLVVGFDKFDLDDPLIGTVVAHRSIDDLQIEFKVGVKFNEGQD